MKVVGISACPAGLAHTPMAAKALEKAGKKIGFDVKMEQQGSMGQVNAITKEEAQAADFVLIASDQHIEGMDRFEGKPVIRVNITTCIKAPEAVLKKCAKAVEKKRDKKIHRSIAETYEYILYSEYAFSLYSKKFILRRKSL